MNVRRATVGDAVSIATVSLRTWQFAYREILPKEYLDNLDLGKRVAGVQKAICEGRPYWVSEHAERIVGFVTAGPNTTHEVVADAELKAIYVLPDCHGLGVGSELLLAATRQMVADGHQSMCVFAFYDNVLARKFYTSTGAREVDTGTYTIAGVDYRDQSYLWDNLKDLVATLESR